MKILAIDPGFDRMGIAILEGNPSSPMLIMSDCILPSKGAKEERLGEIQKVLEWVVHEYAPELIALETLFFSTNRKTAIGVAEARGVVLGVAGRAELAVREYSPQQVKLAVTGHGGADKKAVARMVPKLITLTTKKRLDDEIDAIALGIAALSHRYPQG